MKKGYRQLIINPGSTSTKLAVFSEEEKLMQENIEHSPEELAGYETIASQLPMRMQVLEDFLEQYHVDGRSLSAIVGRGGLVPGLQNGGYEVNLALYHALEGDISSPHASNLGGMMAFCMGERYGIPAYIYDELLSCIKQPCNGYEVCSTAWRGLQKPPAFGSTSGRGNLCKCS